MSRTPLYLRRGYPGHGPRPYRRLLHQNYALRAKLQAVRNVCEQNKTIAATGTGEPCFNDWCFNPDTILNIINDNEIGDQK